MSLIKEAIISDCCNNDLHFDCSEQVIENISPDDFIHYGECECNCHKEKQL